jgi:acyl-CoA reductase-like NAD-dependent aldehyde dehydrogenase
MAADGPTVAQRIVEHPGVPKVAFTGSTRTGKLVARLASEHVKDVTLELGGNDAAILLDDCEFDEMLVGDLIMGAFTTAGQICMGVKRVFVPEGRVAELADAMAEVLNTYIVGPGLDPETTMGPLHNRMQRDRVVELLDDARARGATIRECGSLTGDPEKGYFMLPSLVTGAGDEARIVSEEQFGPALPILGYRTLDEAVARANSTEYGLCSSVWTADEDRGLQVARRLEAGSTFINSHGLFSVDPRAPFGGYKQSGSGREMGLEGVLAFTQRHTVSTRHM